MINTQTHNLQKWRISITVIIGILVFVFLLWDYFHGGVPSHHILHQKDLPAISNWWSGLLLPALSWILLGRMKNRIEKEPASISHVIRLAVIGLIVGLLLAVSFTFNFKPFLDNVLYVLLILCFIVPVFYAEFILGFVLGMTYTFGAILPTAFILIMAAIGFVIYKFVRPLIVKLVKGGKKK